MWMLLVDWMTALTVVEDLNGAACATGTSRTPSIAPACRLVIATWGSGMILNDELFDFG